MVIMLIAITIPENAKCLLKSGQNVEFDTDFLENKVENEIEIPISKKIGIPPAKIFRHLQKFVGENITKGEILAVKKDLFSSRTIICDYDGVVKEVDHEEGRVVLLTNTGQKDTVKAYFKGQVNEINKNTVVIKVGEGKEFELKKTTGSFGGEVCYFNRKENESLKAEQVANKVVVAEAIDSYFQSKAEALGACGYVSLMKLTDSTALPHAVIKSLDDFKKIVSLKHPYCLIEAKNSKIYFYL
jgi:hypothetical protein